MPSRAFELPLEHLNACKCVLNNLKAVGRGKCYFLTQKIGMRQPGGVEGGRGDKERIQKMKTVNMPFIFPLLETFQKQ